MRACVIVLAALVLVTGAYADMEVITGKAAPAMKDNQNAAGVGEGVAPMIGAAANNCGSLIDVGVLPFPGAYYLPGDTTGGGNDFEYGASACGDMGSGGQDEIWQFAVAENSYWSFGTCYLGYSYAAFDTSVQITQDDGSCPGVEVACNGDGAGCANWSSLIEDVFLATGNVYYAIVDGWSTSTYGTYWLIFEKTGDACTVDADCDDGLFCNGVETCDAGTGMCLPGGPLCAPYQVCEEPGICIDPDPCYTWLADDMSGWTGTGNPACTRRWKADDIELDTHGSSRDLISYKYYHQARDYWEGDPVGATFDVETALYFVQGDGSCTPWVPYPGTECVLEGAIGTTGDPAMEMLCEPCGGLPCDPPITLPDNTGNLTLCEIDFFIAERFSPTNPDYYQGQGVSLATNGDAYVGGVGAEDDPGYGINVMAYENCTDEVPNGTFYWTWFGDDDGAAADMGGSAVCTVVLGACCGVGRGPGCMDISEDDCIAGGGEWQGPNTMANPAGCAALDPDGDGYYGTCDNCPNDFNDGQEDCNDDGQGDACSPPEFQDDDGDGTCNGVDGCPDDPNKTDPGQCGCGESDTDTDYDGVADCLDECDNNPVWQTEPPCGCDSTPYDNEDDDGDGFENCFDTCAGVDDAEFGPCDEAIPTVSEWGLVILALLLLAAGKVYFSRRPELG